MLTNMVFKKIKKNGRSSLSQQPSNCYILLNDHWVRCRWTVGCFLSPGQQTSWCVSWWWVPWSPCAGGQSGLLETGWLTGEINNCSNYDIMICISVLCPGDKVSGVMLSICVGTCATVLLRFVVFLPSSLMSSMSSVAKLAFTRCFTVIYFCFYMMLWRGWWTLLTSLHQPPALVLGVGVGVLLLTCSLSSNVGPPLVVSQDSK